MTGNPWQHPGAHDAFIDALRNCNSESFVPLTAHNPWNFQVCVLAWTLLYPKRLHTAR